MKLETDLRYFLPLVLCSALIWLIGPIMLSFLLEAVLTPAPSGKFVPANQINESLNDTLRFVGIIGWMLAIVDWSIRGYPWQRRGWIRKGRAS